MKPLKNLHLRFKRVGVKKYIEILRCKKGPELIMNFELHHDCTMIAPIKPQLGHWIENHK